MKKNLDDCSGLIKSEKIREFVKKALAKAPKEFWLAPGSSRGYHAPEENIEGGLVLHSRKTLRVTRALFRFFRIQEQLVKDKIFAACILHDIQKNGIPWGKHTHAEHGLIAAKWLMEIAAAESNPSEEELVHIDRDLMDIIELVKDHMSIWNQPVLTPALEIGKPVTDKSIWCLIVQLSDYWASRKWCSFIY